MKYLPGILAILSLFLFSCGDNTENDPTYEEGLMGPNKKEYRYDSIPQTNLKTDVGDGQTTTVANDTLNTR